MNTYFFIFVTKKKSLGVKLRPHGGWLTNSMFWPVKLLRSKCKNSHCHSEERSCITGYLFIFNFLKTSGNQMIVYFSTVIVRKLFGCIIATCFFILEKQATILFKNASCTNNFFGYWLILTILYSRLLFTFDLIHLDPVLPLRRYYTQFSTHHECIV